MSNFACGSSLCLNKNIVNNWWPIGQRFNKAILFFIIFIIQYTNTMLCKHSNSLAYLVNKASLIPY